MKKIIHKCKVCGNNFLEYISNHRVNCSLECRNKALSIRLKYSHPRGMLGKKQSTEARKNMSINNWQKNMKGEKSPYWKGEDICYSSSHARVNRHRGQPKYCEICKIKDKKKKYYLANLTGKYWDINDFKRMCASCHVNYDNKRRKLCHTLTRFTTKKRHNESVYSMRAGDFSRLRTVKKQ